MVHLASIVEAILRARETANRGLLQVPGFRAQLIGRNWVWRICREGKNGGVLFAKICRDHSTFRRELAGLALSHRISQASQDFVSSELVFLDESNLLLITQAIHGRSLADFLTSAFRIDRNPFARRRPIESFEACAHQALRWLDALSGQAIPEIQVLRDHSIPTLVTRILDKLDWILESRPNDLSDVCQKASEMTRVASSLLAAQSRVAVVLGDASPSHFIFDGRRVGVIDFEDLGLGDPARDRFALQGHFARLEGNIFYRSVPHSRELHMDKCAESQASAIYQLEVAVDALTNILSRDSRPADELRARRAVRQLSLTVDSCERMLNNRGSRWLGWASAG